MADFPRTVWHYRLHVDVEGADRRNLPEALEEEELSLFAWLDRETAYEQIRAGRLRFDVTLDGPLPSFPADCAALSVYLFQIVKGIEVAERFVSATASDDARAWKVVARQGEWVKLPLVVGEGEGGTFHVDEDADDLEVIAARWTDYPTWFQDGMRRKHPGLRAL